MTEQFALEYIKSRMAELGHGDRYAIRYRKLQLKPNETRKINAQNSHFILIGNPDLVSISSRFGCFDLSDTSTNELQHDFRGEFSTTNQSNQIKQVLYIQATPKNLQPLI